MLEAPALIPLDQFSIGGHKPDDLYVFAFLPGGVAAAQEDGKCASENRKAFHLIHILPEAWRRSGAWQDLHRLALKSECAETMVVKIGGLDARRSFITETCELPPLTRMTVTQEFYSVTYMHAGRLPEKRLGLYSPVRGDAYIIQPHKWSDIWIRGEQILLTGWLTHEGFRSKSAILNAGIPVFQFTHTRTWNLQVRANRLNPLGGLLE